MSTTETIGWLAAIGAMLSFGSFGVPIKSERSNRVDIDPLVFQSYKSFMCFATSWLVLLTGREFSYTPWGIVSCIFWVPGGVATVFAIRNAGLAIAIGVGSSSIVLVSFVWGIFIFEEEIHSRFMACVAIGMMIAGIMGMSFYSSPVVIMSAAEWEANRPVDDVDEQDRQDQEFVCMNTTLSGEDDDNQSNGSTIQSRHPNTATSSATGYEGVDLQAISTLSPEGVIAAAEGREGIILSEHDDDNADDCHHLNGPATTSLHETTRTAAISSSFNSSDQQDDNDDNVFRDEELPIPTRRVGGHHNPSEILHICGMKFTRRQLGIAGAVFNGVWGGSIMAPMRWCKDNTSGVGYLISFGIGAAIVTLALWVMRFAFHLVQFHGSPVKAYGALPSFHIGVMWLPGGTSGLLWSIGNFFSLISVFYLGEGVGYSVVQAGMLVSGLWGIFYFREITGRTTIMKWIASACVTVCGIILLSYEHHKK